MRTLKVKAVILTDATGAYLIHGSSDETPEEMFRAIGPLWQFDPSQETVNFIEMDVILPDLKDLNVPDAG